MHAYQGIAIRTAYVLTGNAADAEEATQDAFVKAYRASGASGRARRSSRGCCGSSRTRRATAAARPDAGRRSRCGRRRCPPGRRPPPRRRLCSTPNGGGAVAALNRLGEPDREAIACRYFLDLSEAETAAALGVRPARSSRARRGRSNACAPSWRRRDGDRARAESAVGVDRAPGRTATSRRPCARACAAAAGAPRGRSCVVLARSLVARRRRLRRSPGALRDPPRLPPRRARDRIRRPAPRRDGPRRSTSGFRSGPATPSARPGSGRSPSSLLGAPDG